MRIFLRTRLIFNNDIPPPLKKREDISDGSFYRLVPRGNGRITETGRGMESSRTGQIVETLIKMARNGTEMRGCIWRARV